MRALVALVVVGASACPPFSTCATDADCGAAAVCSQGLCVAKRGAGGGAAGGASAGGVAGGAVAGGGVGGGTAGGGNGAGAADAGTADGGVDAGVDDAGLDGGPLGQDAGCPSVCPEGFVCASPLESCQLRVVALGFTRPDANDVFGAGQPVRFVVRALANGAVAKPTTLPLTGPAWASGFLALQPSGDWVMDATTPLDGGVFVVSTRWDLLDAGFTASTSVTVDARRPVISLFAEPAPTRNHDGGSFSERDSVSGFQAAYKRDEFVELRVQSTVDLRVTPADFGFPSGSVVALPACTSACAERFCACFSLDLSRVPLLGMRAVLDAGVGPLTDVLGNVGGPVSVALPVTRWRWRRILLENNRPSVDRLHPPALDSDGRVHVGVGYTNSNEGALWQVTPSGDVRVDTGIEEVLSPPLVEGRVMVAQGDNNTQMRRYDTAAPGGMPPQLGPAAGNICPNDRYGAVSALADGRMFHLSQFGSRLFSGLRTAGMPCDEWNAPFDGEAPNGVMTVVPLVSNASRLFYARRDFRLNTGVMRVDYYPTAAMRFQNFRSFSNPNGATSLVAFGEVVAGSATLAVPTNAVAVSAWNVELTARADARTASDAGTTYGPLVAAGTRENPLFLLGDGLGQLHRFPYRAPAPGDPDAGVFAAELTPVLSVDPLEAGNVGATAPVIGANGLVYTVSPSTGRLSVVNLGTGTLEWTVPMAFPAGAVSPALDVLRDAAFGKLCARGLGVLYVAAKNDSAVTAVIVDSAGLDATAPWPRFHHDNGNTGFSETSLAPWSCP